jgi:hypothetical protein
MKRDPALAVRESDLKRASCFVGGAVIRRPPLHCDSEVTGRAPAAGGGEPGPISRATNRSIPPKPSLGLRAWSTRVPGMGSDHNDLVCLGRRSFLTQVGGDPPTLLIAGPTPTA